MLWFFERRDQVMQLETRFDNDTSEYLAIVRWPDGREDTERFSDAESFGARLVVLEQQLETAQWRRSGSEIVPDGWPHKRPSR